MKKERRIWPMPMPGSNADPASAWPNRWGQSTSMLDYRMPIALDLPMIDTVIVEVPNPGHPFGLRGRAGEIPIVPVIGAVANAISNATGVRMTKGPMTPGTIMEMINRAS